MSRVHHCNVQQQTGHWQETVVLTVGFLLQASTHTFYFSIPLAAHQAPFFLEVRQWLNTHNSAELVRLSQSRGPGTSEHDLKSATAETGLDVRWDLQGRQNMTSPAKTRLDIRTDTCRVAANRAGYIGNAIFGPASVARCGHDDVRPATACAPMYEHAEPVRDCPAVSSVRYHRSKV